MRTANGRLRSRRRGRRGAVALAILTCLVALSLTFVLGLQVGRQWARTLPQTAEADTSRRAALSGRDALDDPEVQRPSQIRAKLTFYRTLTAPLAPAPRSSPKGDNTKARANGADAVQPDSTTSRVPAGAATSDHRAPAQSWTVQVAAYRSAASAAALRSSLAASDYDAYVVPSASEDGTVRFRVRVGSYPNRSEAEKIAERLRSERAIAAFVVPR